MKTVTVEFNQARFEYNVRIKHNSLNDCGEWARNCLAETTTKLAIVSNRKVFGLYGEAVKTSLEDAGFAVSVFLMKDGEKHKNFRSLEAALEFFGETRLTRADAVVALGGGVVGDLAGFAAAVFLRGIGFLQIPTTLLAMIDSSVGGKTAVNSAFGKNLIGSFRQPNGVLIDVETLRTLPRRELTAGFCEAIKQGAVGGEKLFKQTAAFLESFSPQRFKKYFGDEKFLAELESLVAAQVAFKARIVMQDAHESIERLDAESRKILNFGHTLAHALEKVTAYKRFKHGEAVGCGILFAARLSKRLDIFPADELNLLNDVVHRAGTLPAKRDINLEKVLEAFAFDKKSFGESVQWILLKSIGEPLIYSNKDIPQTLLRTTLEEFLNE